MKRALGQGKAPEVEKGVDGRDFVKSDVTGICGFWDGVAHHPQKVRTRNLWVLIVG